MTLDPADMERAIAALTPAEAAELDALLEAHHFDWLAQSRPSQRLPIGDWIVWLIMTGRGWGKTRTGAETTRDWWKQGAGYLHLIGPTSADVRDVMVEGESGLLAVHPAHERPRYEPSKRKVTWPNGATALLFSAEEPDRLRGPQCEKVWADELAAWKYPEAWDQALFGLRLGDRPQVVVTTTPRPVRVVRELLKRPDCVVVRGHTNENRANLAEAFLTTVVAKYEGTRLGRQELAGELLEDVPGALWSRAVLEEHRVASAPPLRRIVVGLDPNVTSTDESDEAGIVVAGLGTDGHGYILTDASGRMGPIDWARQAVRQYQEHQADRVVAEVNNGGDMVEITIRTIDPGVAVRKVHASRGKQTRAEPVSALYEQGKVHHVGTFPDLEDQMCGWVPGMVSPDRMDALVWALTDLMITTHGGTFTQGRARYG